MHIRSIIALAVTVLIPSLGSAQEPKAFDADEFVKSVNETLKSKSLAGVHVTGAPNTLSVINEKWAEGLSSSPPQFGVVVYDANTEPVDVLGSNAPLVSDGNDINILGYKLPPGGSFRTVGSAGWTKAVADIAAREEKAVPSEGIQKAVNTVADATDYIASSLCKLKSRPTKLVLNLTAGFELVFSVETGSEVEWDLELVCPRMAQ
jgi:hypothetical protein